MCLVWGRFWQMETEEVPDGTGKPGQRGKVVRKETMQKEKRGKSRGSHGSLGAHVPGW